jgi:ParB family chromosome partitioning protein
VGLIQPIIVYQKEDGKYELIAGQRRFLAVKELGWKNIKTEIIEKPENLYKAKIISLIENTVRKDMVDLDAIDAATEVYGSLKTVSEEIGLEYNTLKKT